MSAETQPCAHPTACIVQAAEGTAYCAWCEAVAAARADERARCAGWVRATIAAWGDDLDGGVLRDALGDLLDCIESGEPLSLCP